MSISLIIPVYNLAGYIERTLDSVQSAIVAWTEAGSVQVVCVDDGSTDGSDRLLDSLCAKYGFHVVHKANGGEGSARNDALATATGDYVMFLDGDDVLLPNAFQETFRLVRECPGADLYAFRYASFADGQAVPRPEAGRSTRVYDLKWRIPSELLCRLGVFPTLFSRSRLGGLTFGNLPLGADRLFVMEFLALAKRAVVSDSVIEGYRLREGSMSRLTWSEKKVRSLNDHASGGLAALSASGRRLSPEGAAYVASLVLSEVPARIARLARSTDTYVLWAHWMSSVARLPVAVLPFRSRFVRRVILLCAASRILSVSLARLFRFLDVV